MIKPLLFLCLAGAFYFGRNVFSYFIGVQKNENALNLVSEEIFINEPNALARELWLHPPLLLIKLKEAGVEFCTYDMYKAACFFALFSVTAGNIFVFFMTEIVPVGLPIKIIVTVFSALLSIFGPRIYLTSRIEWRVVMIEKFMSPFIDLMLVCMDSGYTFIQAFNRVTRELEIANPILHKEFLKTTHNLTYALDIREALRELNQRLPSRMLGLFIETIVQSLEKGSSLYDSLCQLSITSYQEDLLALEKKIEILPMLMILVSAFILLPIFMTVAIAPMAADFKRQLAENGETTNELR